MAETKKKVTSKNQTKSNLIGSQAQPTVLDTTAKLDIDTNKVLIDNIIDAGISGGLDIAALENFTSISNTRDTMYQLIDTMAQDAQVSSIIKTYAEDVCEPADSGHIMWCEASDTKISKYVNYLLNVMNVDKNIYGWAYSLLKYGDVYLKLFRESDYKDELFRKDTIDSTYNMRLNENLDENVNVSLRQTYDAYSGYVEAVPDPSTMFELTKFGKTYGFIEVPNAKTGIAGLASSYMGTDATASFNYKMKSSDVNVYQADDFVHACLEDNFTRFPETVDIFLTDTDYNSGANSQTYSVRRGKSLLYDSYKIWREKSLLESAALLNRITRSSIVRKVSVEVGDMPKEQVKQLLRRVKEMLEQKAAVDVGNSMSEYQNPGPVENNVYFATHNGQGAVTIESVGGDVDVKGLADLDWWNNRFYSSYGVPKQYFGFCLRGNTQMLLLNGTKRTIGEMFEHKEDYVGKGILSCAEDGSLIPTTISNIMLTRKNSDFLRITLDNGEYVDVTPDHRMMLRDGSFVPAEELKVDDSLMPYYDKIVNGEHYILDNKTGKGVLLTNSGSIDYKITGPDLEADYNCKVIFIERLNVSEDAYDITVVSNTHTFALPCGIFVHNCEDGAGFNGGTSLTILSSVYAKGVKRVQNALIQAITDVINLILINRGCNSYLNNFVLKMRAPLTQEELDYRENLSNRINAISNFNGLFNDIEDKANRLKILKSLISTLNYGDEILQVLDAEIDAAEKEKSEALAKAEAESEAAAAAEQAAAASDNGSAEDLELAPMPESLDFDADFPILKDENEFLTEDDNLPSPEDLNSDINFTETN